MVSPMRRLSKCTPWILVLVLGATAVAGAQIPGVVQYEVQFEAMWSAQTHPVNFPGNPHFSPLGIVTHSNQASFWQLGGLATPGIKLMAETGSLATFDTEASAAITMGTADGYFTGAATVSPGFVTAYFFMSSSHPQVTVVSMVAPSPDWFIGVAGLELFANGVWQEQLTVELHAYDSGTDSGVSYTSANAATQPPEPIALITTGPLAGGVPLGNLTFTLIPPPPSYLRGDCQLSGAVDIGDAITLLNHLFVPGPVPDCRAACEANGDDVLNIADVIFLLTFLFQGGAAPGDPFPFCGLDVGSSIDCLTSQCPLP